MYVCVGVWENSILDDESTELSILFVQQNYNRHVFVPATLKIGSTGNKQSVGGKEGSRWAI